MSHKMTGKTYNDRKFISSMISTITANATVIKRYLQVKSNDIRNFYQGSILIIMSQYRTSILLYWYKFHGCTLTYIVWYIIY